jgi:hypothetical protein
VLDKAKPRPRWQRECGIRVEHEGSLMTKQRSQCGERVGNLVCVLERDHDGYHDDEFPDEEIIEEPKKLSPETQQMLDDIEHEEYP